MSQFLFGTAAIALAEASLNRILCRDPATLEKLARLAGRAVQIESTDAPHFRVFILPHAQGLDLMQDYTGKVDAEIAGKVMDLARLPLAGNDVLFGHGVTLSGDSAMVKQLQSALASSDIDWEAWLASLTGDTLGHEAAQLLRSIGRYGRDTSRNLSDDITEYLQEEVRLLPTKVEIEVFLNSVDQVHDGVDRIAARIEKLEQQMQSATKS